MSIWITYSVEFVEVAKLTFSTLFLVSLLCFSLVYKQTNQKEHKQKPQIKKVHKPTNQKTNNLPPQLSETE